MTGEVGKAILILTVVVVAIIVVGSFSMMTMMGGYGWGGMVGPGMMGSGMMGWGGMGFGWMMLLPVIFLVILIVGVYFIVTWLKGEDKAFHVPNTALEVVKERYAKGEITADEFKKMKRDLTG